MLVIKKINYDFFILVFYLYCYVMFCCCCVVSVFFILYIFCYVILIILECLSIVWKDCNIWKEVKLVKKGELEI